LNRCRCGKPFACFGRPVVVPADEFIPLCESSLAMLAEFAF